MQTNPAAEQNKNINDQRVRRISPVGKEKVFGRNDLLKSKVWSSEWKTKGVSNFFFSPRNFRDSGGARIFWLPEHNQGTDFKPGGGPSTKLCVPSAFWPTLSAGAQPGHRPFQPGHVPRLAPASRSHCSETTATAETVAVGITEQPQNARLWQDAVSCFRTMTAWEWSVYLSWVAAWTVSSAHTFCRLTSDKRDDFETGPSLSQSPCTSCEIYSVISAEQQH